MRLGIDFMLNIPKLISCGNCANKLRQVSRKTCETFSTTRLHPPTLRLAGWVKPMTYPHQGHISSTYLYTHILTNLTDSIKLFSPLSTAPTITSAE